MTREFFREGVFQRHWYDAAEKIHPYADYAAGKLADSAKVATEPNTAIEVLRRGRSKRVDMLLDWLVGGLAESSSLAFLLTTTRR